MGTVTSYLVMSAVSVFLGGPRERNHVHTFSVLFPMCHCAKLN